MTATSQAASEATEHTYTEIEEDDACTVEISLQPVVEPDTLDILEVDELAALHDAEVEPSKWTNDEHQPSSTSDSFKDVWTKLLSMWLLMWLC